MSQSNKVSTLWLKGRIRKIDHVCLASMVANNLDVSLYCYDDLSNVPDGIKLKDANEILDISLLERLQCIKKKENNPSQPIANFSDFFRIFLQKFEKGLWLDTDVFIFKPFTYDTERVYFGFEGKGRIGSPVFYLPKDHPIISEYENLIKDFVQDHSSQELLTVKPPYFIKLKTAQQIAYTFKNDTLPPISHILNPNKELDLNPFVEKSEIIFNATKGLAFFINATELKQISGNEFPIRLVFEPTPPSISIQRYKPIF